MDENLTSGTPQENKATSDAGLKPKSMEDFIQEEMARMNAGSTPGLLNGDELKEASQLISSIIPADSVAKTPTEPSEFLTLEEMLKKQQTQPANEGLTLEEMIKRSEKESSEGLSSGEALLAGGVGVAGFAAYSIYNKASETFVQNALLPRVGYALTNALPEGKIADVSKRLLTTSNLFGNSWFGKATGKLGFGNVSKLTTLSHIYDDTLGDGELRDLPADLTKNYVTQKLFDPVVRWSSNVAGKGFSLLGDSRLVSESFLSNNSMGIRLDNYLGRFGEALKSTEYYADKQVHIAQEHQVKADNYTAKAEALRDASKDPKVQKLTKEYEDLLTRADELEAKNPARAERFRAQATIKQAEAGAAQVKVEQRNAGRSEASIQKEEAKLYKKAGKYADKAEKVRTGRSASSLSNGGFIPDGMPGMNDVDISFADDIAENISDDLANKAKQNAARGGGATAEPVPAEPVAPKAAAEPAAPKAPTAEPVAPKTVGTAEPVAPEAATSKASTQAKTPAAGGGKTVQMNSGHAAAMEGNAALKTEPLKALDTAEDIISKGRMEVVHGQKTTGAAAGTNPSNSIHWDDAVKAHKGSGTYELPNVLERHQFSPAKGTPALGEAAGITNTVNTVRSASAAASATSNTGSIGLLDDVARAGTSIGDGFELTNRGLLKDSFRLLSDPVTKPVQQGVNALKATTTYQTAARVLNHPLMKLGGKTLTVAAPAMEGVLGAMMVEDANRRLEEGNFSSAHEYSKAKSDKNEGMVNAVAGGSVLAGGAAAFALGSNPVGWAVLAVGGIGFGVNYVTELATGKSLSRRLGDALDGPLPLHMQFSTDIAMEIQGKPTFAETMRTAEFEANRIADIKHDIKTKPVDIAYSANLTMHNATREAGYVSKVEVQALQAELNEKLGTKLTVDGKFGPATMNAMVKAGLEEEAAKMFGLTKESAAVLKEMGAQKDHAGFQLLNISYGYGEHSKAGVTAAIDTLAYYKPATGKVDKQEKVLTETKKVIDKDIEKFRVDLADTSFAAESTNVRMPAIDPKLLAEWKNTPQR